MPGRKRLDRAKFFVSSAMQHSMVHTDDIFSGLKLQRRSLTVAHRNPPNVNLRSDKIFLRKKLAKSMSEYKEEFNRKLAAFEIVKAEVEAFIAAGGDLRVPEAAPLGLRFVNAANDMWVASGGKPFIVPIDSTAKK